VAARVKFCGLAEERNGTNGANGLKTLPPGPSPSRAERAGEGEESWAGTHGRSGGRTNHGLSDAIPLGLAGGLGTNRERRAAPKGFGVPEPNIFCRFNCIGAAQTVTVVPSNLVRLKPLKFSLYVGL